MNRPRNLAIDTGRVRSAWIVAISADVIQAAIVPAFAPGFASPVNDALDVVVAIMMSVILGWHWAFLPTFLAELIPFFDLVPSWTLACFFATRGKRPDVTPAARP
jgi:hypothetical protein